MRMPIQLLAPFLVVLALSACAVASPESQEDGLRVASWNLEHLAEANGSGCRPRTDADYAALRAHAGRLGADVIAFQEVESGAAARRVFDPAVYDIVMEARPGTPGSRPPCNGKPGLHLNRQATGFAVKKQLRVERHSDLVSLQDGDPNLRSGVDITVTPAGGPPLRLLSVHLKSGCAGGTTAAACDVLSRQAQELAKWIRERGSEPVRFAVLGDFNRRLALPGDPVWAILDQPPGPADMALAAGDKPPACDPRYTSFIDHIVVDSRTASSGMDFSELPYEGDRLSDHCAISVQLTR
jgi:endonuclease/exonuclease/phosphatase family metal-dependent hydrolase